MVEEKVKKRENKEGERTLMSSVVFEKYMRITETTVYHESSDHLGLEFSQAIILVFYSFGYTADTIRISLEVIHPRIVTQYI
jgi:hypothetical protein